MDRVHLFPDLVDRVLAEPVEPIELPLEVVALVFLQPYERVKSPEVALAIAEPSLKFPELKFDGAVLGIDQRVLLLQRFLGLVEFPTTRPRVVDLVPERLDDLALDPLDLVIQVLDLPLTRLDLVELKNLHPVLKGTNLGIFEIADLPPGLDSLTSALLQQFLAGSRPDQEEQRNKAQKGLRDATKQISHIGFTFPPGVERILEDLPHPYGSTVVLPCTATPGHQGPIG